MPRAPSRPPEPAITLAADGDRAALAGVLGVHTLADARAQLKQQRAHLLDLSNLAGLDTPGALWLCELRDGGMRLAGVQAEHQALLNLVCGLKHEPLPKAKTAPRWRQLVIQLGKGADDAWHDIGTIVTFVGHIAATAGHALLHPRSLRPASISRHVAETGIAALPIIALMAILISVVIGYQGVAQLRPYGGEDFTINLVAVSVLREMGVLITAIMVAGRSGSAFAAEIGVMKAREEIDALQAMGLEPMEMLVLPRLVALVVVLPLLTFFADVMGLLGGGLISHSLLGVSPAQYMVRVHQAVTTNDLFVGIVKAPVFAFFIGLIGCMHGMRVRGSAESVGRETTRAVVKGIFLVLTLDALFSVLFEKLGI
ncbi:MAG TPA: ABC transporter permease [Albitalea sp.]|nr:ABC transporter permease [Albitalea sp.]